MNERSDVEHGFRWPSEFTAVAVSESLAPMVKADIDNHEEHHSQPAKKGGGRSSCPALVFRRVRLSNGFAVPKNVSSTRGQRMTFG